MENRLTLVDAIRGFALFGVVVSNVAVVWGVGAARVPGTPLDNTIGYLEAYLITGKFLTLFALLFGASLGLFLRSAAKLREPVIARQLRRLLALLVLGALNRVLLGPDILMNYAVLGAVLLLFRNASDRTLLIAAILSLGIPELWQVAAGWIGYQPSPWPVSRAERLRLAIEGPWIDLVRVRLLRLTDWWNQVLGNGSYLTPFLLGFWAARRRLFDQPEEQRQFWRRLWWSGIAFTLLGYAAQAALRPVLASGSAWAGVAFGLVWTATTLVQGVSYGAGLVMLWLVGGRVRQALAWLAPAGRMALTNYIAASVIITLVVGFTHSYSSVGLATASLIGAGVWLAEIVWSHSWLARYRLGPMEWLWRTLSGGTAKSVRQSAT